MKYICMYMGGGDFEIFVFPKTVDHDVMAEAIVRMKNQPHGSWEGVLRTPISAGFVDREGNCYGESESLGLESRNEEDTAVLKSQN